MKQAKILLIEDNQDDVALTLRAFKKSGIRNEIIIMSDGVEATDYLFGRGTYAEKPPLIEPHIIFLDLQLPKKDGMSVLREIKTNESTLGLPVIILTSSEEEQDKINSHFFGANIFASKPVHSHQFIEIIAKLELTHLLRFH